MQASDIELGTRNVIPAVHSPVLSARNAAPQPKLRGFALLTSKIALDRDKTTTIYRRFDELSATNLVFYEAELAELEEQLKDIDEEDSRIREDEFDSQKDWLEFERKAGEGMEVERRRMELVIKIRDRIEKYHTALAAHQVLLNSPPPSSSTVKAMRSWFFNNTSNTSTKPVPRLWGASSNLYSNPSDLVALRVPANQDRLSLFIQNNFSLLFRITSPSSHDGHTAYISETSLSYFVAILSTILAALLLLGAIISLYIVKNEKALLGMLSGWTVLFAACVGLLTNARRDQIFGATAAYAAVLVVFVSGNLGSDGGGGVRNCVCTAG
ncbi:hypothetical protein B0J14DRAFT_584138 [Halenospora varia]|nr:hypothetical protein B0J14DRAFT_584138 [Halenospora varia]